MSFLIAAISLCSYDIFSDENTRQKDRNSFTDFNQGIVSEPGPLFKARTSSTTSLCELDA